MRVCNEILAHITTRFVLFQTILYVGGKFLHFHYMILGHSWANAKLPLAKYVSATYSRRCLALRLVEAFSRPTKPIPVAQHVYTRD